MNLFAVIGQAFKAVAAWFSHATHRSQIKNAPEIKKAEAARQEVKLVEESRKAIASQDTDEIRKGISE